MLSNLSTGIYNVYFLSASGWNDANIKKTLAVDVNAGPGFAAIHEVWGGAAMTRRGGQVREHQRGGERGMTLVELLGDDH